MNKDLKDIMIKSFAKAGDLAKEHAKEQLRIAKKVGTYCFIAGFILGATLIWIF
jgi:hypothetical protein